VARGLRARQLVLRPHHRSLDLREALRRHEIGMRRQRTVGEVFYGLAFVRLLGECAAHTRKRVGRGMVSQGPERAAGSLSPLPLAGEGKEGEARATRAKLRLPAR